MNKLTDLNPYEILQITPDANSQVIKRAMAERQRENKDQSERQQALTARRVLSSVETRLLVDALLPMFTDGVSETELIAQIELGSNDQVDWLAMLDLDRLVQQDFSAYLELIIQYTLGEIPLPTSIPQLTSEFDGLDEFLSRWLK